MPAERPEHDAARVLRGFGRSTASVAAVRHVAGADAVTDAVSAGGPRGLLARGRGRSYGDAAQNAGGAVLDVAPGLDHVHLDEAAGTVTASAGASLDELLRVLVPRGWFVPVTPGTRHVSLGGALAADVHGKNHHLDGSFAQHVTRFRLVTPIGTREVTPQDDADVFWATAGGMGLTGVVTDLTLRLLPITTSRVLVDTERADDLDDLMERMVSGDHRYRYSVAWVDTAVGGRHLGRGVLTRGDHADVADLPAGPGDPLAYGPDTLGTLPRLPVRMVRPATIRAFNAAWFRRAPVHREGEPQPLAGFFHPLDALDGWNGLYGPRGFVQYQFVVPPEEGGVVQRVLATLHAAGLPSGMAVLKRFGEADPGPLSFPMPGWTLALDLAVGPERLRPVLTRVDAWVAEAGGRVYLAKDATTTPEVMAAMYPRLDAWRAVRDRLDPDHALQSDLARRLHLIEDGPR